MKQIYQMIAAYQPQNVQEANDKEMILWLCRQYEDLCYRSNLLAHFTASAFVVNEQKNKALMVYHNIYDSWGWTGGHADGDDNLLRVAVKETLEETGIAAVKPWRENLLALDILPVHGHIKKGRYVTAHLHLNAAFILMADEKLSLSNKPDENSAVEWLPLDKLHEFVSEPLMLPIYQKLINRL